jgi:glycosyltransferase involved in cell wall biosynthesis
MRTPDQVSVIVPTYNRAPLLREALESVFGQTQPVGEVIVVDDGSTDDTRSVVREYESQAPAVHYIHLVHTNNLGMVRNAGIQRATGNIIALLDSDDVWLPARVERQLLVWNRITEAGFAFCNVRRFNAQGTLPDSPWLNSLDDYSGRIVCDLLLEPVAVPSALMFNRQVFENVGPYSRRAVNEDYEWLLEASARYPASYTPDVLVKMRAHEGSRSRLKSLQAHTEYVEIVRHFVRSHPELTAAELSAARTGLANVHIKIARHLIQAGDRRRAAPHAARAVRLSPSDRRGYALLFAALWGRGGAQPARVLR